MTKKYEKKAALKTEGLQAGLTYDKKNMTKIYDKKKQPLRQKGCKQD